MSAPTLVFSILISKEEALLSNQMEIIDYVNAMEPEIEEIDVISVQFLFTREIRMCPIPNHYFFHSRRHLLDRETMETRTRFCLAPCSMGIFTTWSGLPG